MNRKQFFQAAKVLIDSGEETLICDALCEAYGRASFRTDQDYEVLQSCLKTIREGLGSRGTLTTWCRHNGLKIGVGLNPWYNGVHRLARMAWLDKLIEAEK